MNNVKEFNRNSLRCYYSNLEIPIRRNKDMALKEHIKIRISGWGLGQVTVRFIFRNGELSNLNLVQSQFG